MVSDVVIPFQATTTFDDYAINTGRPIAFEVPLPDSAGLSQDSLRALRRAPARLAPRASGADAAATASTAFARGTTPTGGPGAATSCTGPRTRRWTATMHWPDSLSLEADPADARRLREAEAELARLAETLPGLADRPGGRTGSPTSACRTRFRYDRVQGLSFGLGYRVRMPGIQFANLYGTVRYGFSDDRVTGRLSLVRDAPGRPPRR